MKLVEWIGNTGSAVEFPEIIQKFGDLEIVKEYEGYQFAFPQKHRNYRHVFNWVLLEDGSAVGWNESPRNGWNFVRVGKKTVSELHKDN